MDANDRESGFLIPTIGESSTKGLILGEQIYMVLGRSADLTVGGRLLQLALVLRRTPTFAIAGRS